MKALIIIIILFALVVWAGWLLLQIKKDHDEFSPELVGDINYDPETSELSFVGGRTGKRYVVRGSGTVWHSLSGQRCDTFTESQLSDIYHTWKYGGPRSVK